MSKKKNKNSNSAAEQKEIEEKLTAETNENEEEAVLSDEDTSSDAVKSDSENFEAEDDYKVETFDDDDDDDDKDESSEALEKFEKSEEESEKKAKEKSAEKEKKKIDPIKAEKKAERKSKRELKARAFKRGWFSIALVAFFLAAVILVNLIASTLVKKIPALVIDTTGSDNFELTEDTLDYLAKLEDDIKIMVLSDEKELTDSGEYLAMSNTLLHEYENKSDKITLQYVDMTSDPTFVSQYPDESLSQFSIIVQGDKNYKYITPREYLNFEMDYNTYQQYISGSNIEEAITSAILNVTLEEKPKVTFISDINDNNYTAFKSLLDTNGFETDEVSPAGNKIPDDTKILVLYAPSTDLESTFVDKISEFLNNNGNYGRELLYIPSEKLIDTPNIDSLIEEWGMSIEKGYAYENDTNYLGMISYNVYLYITQYADTTYTQKMKNSSLPFCVIEGYTVPIEVNDTENVKTLFTLSDQSQVIYPTESSDEPEKKDEPNLVLGAVSTKGKSGSSADSDDNDKSNVVVIGSSVALSDSLLSSGVYGNSSYIVALFNTLIDRDNVGVTIEPKSMESAELGITTAKIRILTVIFVILVPLTILITGIVIFIRRRNL